MDAAATAKFIEAELATMKATWGAKAEVKLDLKTTQVFHPCTMQGVDRP
jgi:hypothetical protein